MKKEPKIKTLLGLNEEELFLDEGKNNKGGHSKSTSRLKKDTREKSASAAKNKAKRDAEKNPEEKGLAIRKSSEVSKKEPEEKGLATIDKPKKDVAVKKAPKNKKDSDEDIIDAEYTIQDDPDEENKDNDKGKEGGDKNNSTSLAPRKPTKGSTTISINWKGLIEAAWDKEPDKRQPQNLLKAVTNILKVGQAMKKYEEAKGANNA